MNPTFAISQNAKIFSVISFLLLILMIYISKDWGPSNDEKFNVPYADLALDYYTTLGSNDTVLTTTTKMDPVMKNYGVIIELPAHWIHRTLGADLYWIRHVFITLFSFLYIFFGALIAKRLTGSWFAAYLAFAFLVLTPRIFGESFNNPKDPPYCGTTMMSLYAFIVFLDALPKPSWRKTIFLMIGIAVSLLIRISGLMTDFFFTVFLVYELYKIRKIGEIIDIKDLLKKLGVAYTGGYFLGILFWPAMINAPFSQPFDTLNFLRNLPVTVRTLFEGKYLSSAEVPWYYLPKYFLISNPEVILLGIFLGFILLFSIFKVYKTRRVVLLLSFGVIPLVLIIQSKTGLLTGWRHGYFIYIPLVVFSAVAYTYLVEHKIVNQLYKRILVALIFIGLVPTLLFMIRNYPLFYIYFNPISGGIKNALGNYEIDYYTHSAKPATDWLIKNVPDLEKKQITSNNGLQVGAVLQSNGLKNPVSYSRFRERYDQDWDYGIFTHSFIEVDYLKNGFFPPKGTIKSIEVDGVPVCAIIKREDKNDYYGKKALDSNQFPKAIEYLLKAVQYDQNNEIAWTNLGMAQLQSNQPAQAIESLNKALAISPENLQAKNILGYAYLNTGNVSNAQYIFLQMIEENPNNPEPYRILAQIYQQQGNGAQAQQYMSIYQQITSQMGR